MSLNCRDNGQRLKLIARLKKALASTALVAALSAGLWSSLGSPAMSGGETRTLSMKQIHTGETITITYMVNGKYVPSAMKKINWFLRDWRRNEATTMDPRTIDLVWELHADLGSKKPVHIVSGFRSAKTNAFLKRSGRNVAKKSQHIQGKAMDIFFPDVPTIKMRNSALVRKVGGVGYYRSSGGPTGFLHVDSGRVRHWGPGISSREMAKIIKDYGKTVGARKNKAGMIAVAGTDTMKDGKAKAAPETSALYDNEDMAELAENAAQAPATPKDKPKLEEPVAEVVAEVTPVPKPRAKPIEILMAAAMNIKVEPVSAPPEDSVSEGDAPVSDGLSMLIAASALMEGDEPTVASGKGNPVQTLGSGTEQDLPTIRPIMAATDESNFAQWPSLLTMSMAQELRLNGQAPHFAESAVPGILPGSAEAAAIDDMPQLNVAPSQQEVASTGKGDMLVVNREGKGNFGELKKLKAAALR
jgi:uncharacterized protein YcbK (DUF882 family)